MESQEKLDILNKRLESRSKNWRYRSDIKKFGWGLPPKNRNCKKFGYFQDKISRKDDRKFIKLIKHKMFKHIPLTESEIDKSSCYSQIYADVQLYLNIVN